MIISILKRYPELEREDVIIRDDGNGPFVSYWNSDKPKPTQEEIISWYEADQSDAPKTDIELLKEENLTIKLALAELAETLFGGA